MNSQKRIRTSLNGLTKVILFPDTYEELFDTIIVLYNLAQGNMDSLYFTYFDDELDRVSVSNNYDLHQALIFTHKECISILPMDIHLQLKHDLQDDPFNSIIFNKTTQTTHIQNEEPNYFQEFSFHKYTQYLKDIKSPNLLRSELDPKIIFSNKIEVQIKFVELTDRVYHRFNLRKFYRNLKLVNKTKENIFPSQDDNLNINENDIIKFNEKFYLNLVKNHLGFILDKNVAIMKEKIISKIKKDMKKYIKKIIKYQNELSVHHAACEECDLQVPIKGIRYKCSVCENYNLCSSCEKATGHLHSHPFIKIRKPEILLEDNNIITLRSSVPHETELNKIYNRKKLFDELKSLFKL